MTTYVPFTPSGAVPFAYQAVLDGDRCQITASWNVFGQRWYFSVFDSNGDRVVTLPLIGSTDTYSINLLAGYYQSSTMVYRVSTNQVELGP